MSHPGCAQTARAARMAPSGRWAAHHPRGEPGIEYDARDLHSASTQILPSAYAMPGFACFWHATSGPPRTRHSAYSSHPAVVHTAPLMQTIESALWASHRSVLPPGGPYVAAATHVPCEHCLTGATSEPAGQCTRHQRLPDASLRFADAKHLGCAHPALRLRSIVSSRWRAHHAGGSPGKPCVPRRVQPVSLH